MYTDPITRQSFSYATPICGDDLLKNVKELDPDNDEHYVMTAKLVMRSFKQNNFNRQ